MSQREEGKGETEGGGEPSSRYPLFQYLHDEKNSWHGKRGGGKENSEKLAFLSHSLNKGGEEEKKEMTLSGEGSRATRLLPHQAPLVSKRGEGGIFRGER